MSPATLFWVLLAQAIGGSTPIITKLGLEGLTPWQLAAGRQFLGTLILYSVARASGVLGSGRHEPFDRRDWLLLLCLAWAGFALPMVLLVHGVERSTATNGALMAPVEPIGILLGGALVLGERLTAVRFAAIALGALGATLIVLGGEVTPGVSDPIGDLLIFAGYAAWSIYTLAAKPLLDRHDATRISVWAIALTVPPLVAIAALQPVDLERALPALVWVVVLAFTATSLATYAWNRALGAISASTMAAFIFVQPVVGAVLGPVVLGERIGWLAALGTLVAIAGVVLAALRGETQPARVLPQSALPEQETIR